MELGEDGREQLAKALHVVTADHVVIDLDDTALRHAQPGEDLQRRGLARAVAADEEDGLAAIDGEIQRADREPAVRIASAAAALLRQLPLLPCRPLTAAFTAAAPGLMP